MASPVVEATATSNETTAVQAHAISLPTGVSSGDLVIAIFCENRLRTVTWPGGWTEFFDDTEGSTTGQDSHVAIAYRQADGTEGASISVSTDFDTESCHASYRISGAADPSTQAPEAAATNTGNDAAPDPPSLTPTGGEKDYLWIAVGSQDDNVGASFTAAPTNYSGLLSENDGVGAGIGVATRDLTASSENPGAFTVSNSARWLATTIAVHPAATGSAGLEGSVWIEGTDLHWIDENDTEQSVTGTGISHLSLPGESGDYASTPDATALDITGDIDLRAAVALDDWTPGSATLLIEKASSPDGYRLDMASSGRIELVWGDGGSLNFVTSSTAPTVSDGALLLVRATLDVDNGSGGYDVKFYTKSSTPSTAHADLIGNAGWSQLGTTQTGGSTTSITASSKALSSGGAGGAFGVLSGKVYALAVLDGIDGTVVFNADFTDHAEGTTSFTEDSSNAATVTINQSGSPQAEIIFEENVGVAGSVWIHGSDWLYLDVDGQMRRIVGTDTTNDPTGAIAGSAWVEGADIHYIDADGNERTISS